MPKLPRTSGAAIVKALERLGSLSVLNYSRSVDLGVQAGSGQRGLRPRMFAHGLCGAAVTNLVRVGGRQHWVSDTVSGSALGYAIGKIFWESARNPRKKGEPRVLVHPSGVNVAWELN